MSSLRAPLQWPVQKETHRKAKKRRTTRRNRHSEKHYFFCFSGFFCTVTDFHGGLNQF